MTLLLKSVVLAEDDPEISSMVKEYFERAYDLSVATTDKVDEIIPLVLKTKASVLIMDLELKDGDASQVVSDVAEIDGLVVIVLTGTWKGREENKLLKDGAQVVMRKPQKPSTIWQQVLNLRGTRQRSKDKPKKIRILMGGGYYDLQDGVIIEEKGKRIYLSDKNRVIMDMLANRLASDQAKESVIEISEGGWVIKEDIIEGMYGKTDITSDVVHSFWYSLKTLKKILNESIDNPEGVELIENMRVGRTESYYRLKPESFVVEILDSDEESG
jgi:DNA-binding response OmpR family regulator